MHFLADSPPSSSEVLADMLSGYGLDVHMETHSGDTPLHEATRSGNMEIMKILLRLGASMYSQNRDGETPLDIAQTKQRRDLVKCLGGVYVEKTPKQQKQQNQPNQQKQKKQWWRM